MRYILLVISSMTMAFSQSVEPTLNASAVGSTHTMTIQKDSTALATLDENGAVAIMAPCEEIVKVVFSSLQQQNAFNLKSYQGQQSLVEAYKNEAQSYGRQVDAQRRLIELQKKQIEILRKGLTDVQKTLKVGK